MGISIGTVTQAGTVTGMEKTWRTLQALGAIAFAYSYSIILIEIQVCEGLCEVVCNIEMLPISYNMACASAGYSKISSSRV